MDYIPVVSGIFFISGVFFDAMMYSSVGTIAPYGPEETILQRSSMYGFALGAFLMGFGSQLAGGDIIFHSCSQIANGKWFSIFLTIIILATSILTSFIMANNKIPFLTDSTMNPIMENLHLLSANITIVISLIILGVSTYSVY